MKASDLFVKCLEEESIEYIFGVPGEENADFMISLEQSKSIKFILTRQEQGAAFMAEIYGRLTGNPAGCLGTLGPGATNLITGVADANMDRAPMLVLTGQGDTARLHKESHQVMDVVEMFDPVTKWAVSIRDADSIPEIVRKAVRLARTEKPGAVHIELPEDIAKHDASLPPMQPKRYRRSVPDPVVIKEAVEKILQAKNPVVLAGNGCIRKRSSAELREFCELTGIGVINTFMAKGCVDMDAPYCLYTIGLGSKDYPSFAIDAADLVISIGYDMVEYPPRLWNADGDKDIIHIDFLMAEIDDNYDPNLELIGDVANAMASINTLLKENDVKPRQFVKQQKVRSAMSEALVEHMDDATEGSIRPQKVLYDVRDVLTPDGLVLSDVGAHKMWIARHFQCHEPNTCLIPNGFCSMGFALPGAIAASLIDPSRQIVAICGDAGFLMNVQEMETARRLNSNIVAMIWEDHAYGLIAWKQQNEFGKHTDLSFGNPDWIQLAHAFGWSGIRVERSADLAAALAEALGDNGPTLLVLPIDYRENQLLTERLGKITCPI